MTESKTKGATQGSKDSDRTLVDLVKGLDRKLAQVTEQLRGLEERLTALEKRNRLLAAPLSQSTIRGDRDSRLGDFDYDVLTPALRQTYDIVKDLACAPNHWASLEDIVGKSPR